MYKYISMHTVLFFINDSILYPVHDAFFFLSLDSVSDLWYTYGMDTLFLTAA